MTEQKNKNSKFVNAQIAQAFDTANKKAFIAFITAGDPDAESSVKNILEIARGGADLIEIGIPFSDPTAEGVVIQEANIRALQNGITTDGVFEIVRRVREQCDVPLCFMTYANPVFHYGYDRFFAKCEELSVAGIIIPDMPYEEKKEAEKVAVKYNQEVISLIAPTSEDRIKMIASDAKGFIYLVSSLGVTGVRSEFKFDLSDIVKEIRKYTDVPVAIGFGISNPDAVKKMCAISDGAIVGSAIVKIIEEHGKDSKKYIYDFCKSMVEAAN